MEFTFRLKVLGSIKSGLSRETEFCVCVCVCVWGGEGERERERENEREGIYFNWLTGSHYCLACLCLQCSGQAETGDQVRVGVTAESEGRMEAEFPPKLWDLSLFSPKVFICLHEAQHTLHRAICFTQSLLI